MTRIIWTGEVFHEGRIKNGRVVRDLDQGDLVFEIYHGQTAMSEPIWLRRHEPFLEFLRAAGAAMDRQPADAVDQV